MGNQPPTQGPDLAIEEELREDLKQLQARGVQNWDAEEVFYFFALLVSF